MNLCEDCSPLSAVRLLSSSTDSERAVSVTIVQTDVQPAIGLVSLSIIRKLYTVVHSGVIYRHRSLLDRLRGASLSVVVGSSFFLRRRHRRTPGRWRDERRRGAIDHLVDDQESAGLADWTTSSVADPLVSTRHTIRYRQLGRTHRLRPVVNSFPVTSSRRAAASL